MWKGGWAYILTNRYNRVLYAGATSDLHGRVKKHKNKYYPNCFTAKYNVTKLVYFKFYPTILEAIAEEKRIKAGSRKQKVKLIVSMNPEWKELPPPEVDKSNVP